MSRSYRKSLCTRNRKGGSWIRRMKHFAQRNVRNYRYFDEVSNGGWYRKLCDYSYLWDYGIWKPFTETGVWREINENPPMYWCRNEDPQIFWVEKEKTNKKARFQSYYKNYKAK